jgi:hypothetical protein
VSTFAYIVALFCFVQVVERNKVYPGVMTSDQIGPKVEALGRHLGGFHKAKVQILSALHSSCVNWLTGGKPGAPGAKQGK